MQKKRFFAGTQTPLLLFNILEDIMHSIRKTLIAALVL